MINSTQIHRLSESLYQSYRPQYNPGFRNNFLVQEEGECHQVIQEWIQWQLERADERLLLPLFQSLAKRFEEDLTQWSREEIGC